MVLQGLKKSLGVKQVLQWLTHYKDSVKLATGIIF